MHSRPLTGAAPEPADPEPAAAAPRPRRTPRLGLTPTAATLLTDGLHGSRRALLRIAALSAVEAAPALASGWVTAAALDHGFLAHRPGTGLAWLGILALLYLVRACAERAMFDSLAAVVEPLRDHLTRRVVHNTLRQATELGRDPGTASVSRLSSQIDATRGLLASLLRTARPLAATLLAALVGLAGLDPLLALLVLVPLTAALALFARSMRRLTALRRDTLLASEEVAHQIGAVLGAARDITSSGPRSTRPRSSRRSRTGPAAPCCAWAAPSPCASRWCCSAGTSRCWACCCSAPTWSTAARSPSAP
ncbi:hypothetical protein GCM10025734_22410 [Kitasatospora paranensis]|uniref:hypothetical protein n=1 Tax=Kitasatospora paranensis TaxID=258053 RepID=UPI0031EC7672